MKTDNEVRDYILLRRSELDVELVASRMGEGDKLDKYMQELRIGYRIKELDLMVDFLNDARM
jgi:hypothetical protein